MRIKAKLGIWIGVGLVILFALLAVNMTGNHLERVSALPGEQALATGENLNESDNGTWLEEYESDGVRGVGGVPVKTLPAGKAALLGLLLVLSGALAVAVEGRKTGQKKTIVVG